CAIRVYRLGQLGVLGNDTLVPRRTAKKERAFAHGVGPLLLGNDERSATHGALAVKGNVAITEDVVVRIIEGFSGHHDAVLDRGAADGERSPDVGQGGECCWHRAFSFLFPPPLRGRIKEGGCTSGTNRTLTAFPYSSGYNCTASPHPSLPPQGGKESKRLALLVGRRFLFP